MRTPWGSNSKPNVEESPAVTAQVLRNEQWADLTAALTRNHHVWQQPACKCAECERVRYNMRDFKGKKVTVVIYVPDS